MKSPVPVVMSYRRIAPPSGSMRDDARAARRTSAPCPRSSRLRVIAGSVEMEEAQPLAQAAADAHERAGRLVPVGSSTTSRSRSAARQAAVQSRICWIGVARSADACAPHAALGVEDPGEEALAPVVARRHAATRSALRIALDTRSGRRADRRASRVVAVASWNAKRLRRDAAHGEVATASGRAPRRRRAPAGSGDARRAPARSRVRVRAEVPVAADHPAEVAAPVVVATTRRPRRSRRCRAARC